MYTLIVKHSTGELECLLKDATLAEAVALKTKIEIDNKNFFTELNTIHAAAIGSAPVSQQDFGGSEQDYLEYLSKLEAAKELESKNIESQAPEYFGADLFIF